MNIRKAVYWVTTVLIALAMLFGGLAQVSMQPQNVEGFAKLGYPLHFMVMLGVWKILGGLTLLAPRLPLVKEWAYAGIFIDFVGATVANAANDGGVGHIAAPVIMAGMLCASWALRPESRRLARR